MDVQMFKLDSEKVEEPEVKLPTFVGESKKQESSRKACASALLTMPKPLTVYITISCGEFLKRWEYQTPICLLRNLYGQKQQLELHMEKQTGSEFRKEYVKAV